MKFKIFTLTLLLLGMLFPVSAQKRSKSAIAFYNVENFYDTIPKPIL